MKCNKVSSFNQIQKQRSIEFNVLLLFLTLLLPSFSFAQSIPYQEGQVYVCPLASKIEEINPKCGCRVDLKLKEKVESFCEINGEKYEMTLFVIDHNGKEYFAIHGFVNGGAGINFKPQAKISGEFTGRVGEKLNFSAKESFDPNGDPLDFFWDFGDGNFGQGENVFHIYEEPGQYFITLRAEDGLDYSIAAVPIIIEEKSEELISGEISEESKEKIIPLPSQTKKLLERKERNDFGIEEKAKELIKNRKETPETAKFLFPFFDNFAREFLKPNEKEFFEERPEEFKTKETLFSKNPLLANLFQILKRENIVLFGILLGLILLFFGTFKIKGLFFKRKN